MRPELRSHLSCFLHTFPASPLSTMSEFNAAQFEALRTVVHVARDENLTKVALVRRRAVELGHKPEDVDAALRSWAEYETRKAGA